MFIVRILFFCLLALPAWAQKTPKPTDCVGKMAGECITYQDFMAAVTQEMQASDLQEAVARDIVWNKFLYDKVFLPEIQKVGLHLTPEEVDNLLWGDSAQVLSSVRQQFTKNGRFEREKLLKLKEEAKDNLYLQESIKKYQEGLGKDKLRSDLENLMKNSHYISQAEINQLKEADTQKAHVRYVYIPYESVSDSLFLPTITEVALEKQLQSLPEKYKIHERFCNIIYIALPVAPDRVDSTKFSQDMQKIARGWGTAQDIWAYAVENTTVEKSKEQNQQYQSPQNLPHGLFQQPFKLVKNNISAPFLDGNAYKIVYVVDVREDTTLNNVRANHIYFKADKNASEAIKTQARLQAEAVLDSLQKGADFATMARRHGGDGTAALGGDLGWFGKGIMVKSFEEPIFKAKKEGLLPYVIQTDFGYHIVEVTATANHLAYQVAVIERAFMPTEETEKRIKKQASELFEQTKTVKDLRNFAQQNPTYNLREQIKMLAYSNSLNSLTRTKKITQWAFEASEGETALFEINSDTGENYWVIAGLTQKINEDEVSVKAARADLVADVLREEKAKHIMALLSWQTNPLEKIAKQYGQGAYIQENRALVLEMNALRNEGFDPTIVGKAMGLPEGKRALWAGEMGVYVVEKIKNFTVSTTKDDNAYRVYKNQPLESMATYFAQEALRKFKKVKDYRYKFW